MNTLLLWVSFALLVASNQWASIHVHSFAMALEDTPAASVDVDVLELLELVNKSSNSTSNSNKTSKILNGPSSKPSNSNQNYYGPNNLIRPVGSGSVANGDDLAVQSSGQPASIQNHPHISDVDMQLLGAMEKLVAKMEKLESRVKTLESIVYYLTNKEKPIEQGNCPAQFSKVDGIKGKCYRVSSLAKSGGGGASSVSDWKSASGECNRLGGRLVEMLSYSDFHRLVSFLQKYAATRSPTSAATDFWTGGLNPGLIWIWSESGQQIDLDKRFWNENDNSSSAPGCLKLSFSARLNTYFFKSAPCQQVQNYVCEILDNAVARALADFEETVLA